MYYSNIRQNAVRIKGNNYLGTDCSGTWFVFHPLEVESGGFLGVWDQSSQDTALDNSQSNIVTIMCLNNKQRTSLGLFADSIIIYSKVIRYKVNTQKSIIF